MNKRKRIYIRLTMLVGLSMLVGISIGYNLSSLNSIKGMFNKGDNKLEEVFSYIGKSYVDTVNIDELKEKAISIVTSQLDPHTVYISAEEIGFTGYEFDGYIGDIEAKLIASTDATTIPYLTVQGSKQHM